MVVGLFFQNILRTNRLLNLSPKTLSPYYSPTIVTKRSRWAANYSEPVLPQEQEENPELCQDLTFNPIRPVPIRKSSSVFYDKTYERFLLLLLRKGDYGDARLRMERSFFEIKLIQINRINKTAARAAEANEKGGIEKTSSTDQPQEIVANPMELLHRAVENCKPILITKGIRRGGATYQVPFPLTPEHSEFRGMKWLIETILDRPKPKKKRFHEEMAREIIDASNNDGRTVKRKQDMHRQAEANKAYAHYRWG